MYWMLNLIGHLQTSMQFTSILLWELSGCAGSEVLNRETVDKELCRETIIPANTSWSIFIIVMASTDPDPMTWGTSFSIISSGDSHKLPRLLQCLHPSWYDWLNISLPPSRFVACYRCWKSESQSTIIFYYRTIIRTKVDLSVREEMGEMTELLGQQESNFTE